VRVCDTRARDEAAARDELGVHAFDEEGESPLASRAVDLEIEQRASTRIDAWRAGEAAGYLCVHDPALAEKEAGVRPDHAVVVVAMDPVGIDESHVGLRSDVTAQADDVVDGVLTAGEVGII